MGTLLILALATVAWILSGSSRRVQNRAPGQVMGTPWFTTGVYQAQGSHHRNARVNPARQHNRRGNSARWR
jgi:hypothetical protein